MQTTNNQKLYIIGNGFDKGHELACGYEDFYKYLENNRKDILMTLSEFYDIREKSQLWADFENNLEKEINYDSLTEIIKDNIPNLASEDFRDRDWYTAQYEIENKCDELLNELRNGFEEWINSLQISKLNKTYNLDPSAYYLTFNYTEVLEIIYRIPTSNITHIHNKVREKLIFGHGKNIEDFNVKEALYGTKNPFISYDINGDIESHEIGHEQFAENAVYTFYDKMRKHTEEIINNHSAFFNQLSNIKEVIVLGHSYNEIDKPYFKHIAASISPNAKWILCYYNDEDKKHAIKLMKELNIKQNLQEYKQSNTLKINL